MGIDAEERFDISARRSPDSAIRTYQPLTGTLASKSCRRARSGDRFVPAAEPGLIAGEIASPRALIGAGAGDLPAIVCIRAAGKPVFQLRSPYDLLARRPDLQVACRYVQASLNQVNAARALFYLSFDIKAFSSAVDSIHPDKLFENRSKQI